MASGSAPAGGSAPLRRGLISCLHSLACRADDAHLLSDEDLPQAIYKLIVRFYEEAFDRLPCRTMLDLVGLLSTGGFCLGLLDPVSNIILNTLALLPKDAAAAAAAASSTSPPGRKRSKRSGPGWDAGLHAWHEVATRSCQSLLAFLMAYFGCLTKVQATRYLYRADANLPLAVMLVQHDLYVEGEEAVLDPESDRTHAALEWAATRTGHPSPSVLAQVMAIRLKQGDLDIVQKHFSGDGSGAPLTVEDVLAVHRILHLMMTPMCAANITHTKNGMVVHVRQNLEATWSETTPSGSTTADAVTTSTAFCWDGTPISSVQLGLPDKLQCCLRIADGQKHILKNPCGDACDYLQSLKMYLHGMIHNMYVKALKLLPTPSGSLMRSILMAGHCYGSMDPVSNIIVNSIWYDKRGCPLPESQRTKIKQYNDVLDPLSLLRIQVHSLKGLTELAAVADPQFSVAACVLENLGSAKCDIATMLPSSIERFEKNPFHEASVAARHPLPLQQGELHQQLLLMPVERNKLLSLMTEARTTGNVVHVDDIASIVDIVLSSSTTRAPTPVLIVQAPKLCEKALSVVSRSRSQYEERRSWFRSKIQQLLEEYESQHFSGSNYKLDVIFGVEEKNHGRPPLYDKSYHVNFMATSDLKLQRTLFYAEFGSSPSRREPKPEFCCPLPYASGGRCYYGEHSARKIVYPDDAKYIPGDITHDGTGSVDRMLEMDLVYFSPELDVELAENLNILPSSEFESVYE